MLLAASAMLVAPVISAQAYNPVGGIVYELGDEPCLKGRGNCAVYAKSAQLPSGRLVMSFEKSTVVPETGGADGQTLPIYKSDDFGTSWQYLSEVKAPAYLSDDPQYARYVSNWTSPYLYVLPQDVGGLAAGTLLLASVVSGEDYYYQERKAADPTWVPTNDGDRKDMAIALFSSVDEGVTWEVVNVIATGGWQGGSAGAAGTNVASANTYRQIDPLWEPYLMVYQDQLVAYYSDENEYIGFDPVTGIAQRDPDNDTAPDKFSQVLVHKTWDGTSTSEWSEPVIDIQGGTFSGSTTIGSGRPGMSNVVQTTDGKWLLTYEYWGSGNQNVRYKISDDPLRFFEADGGSIAGRDIRTLPVASGSRGLARGSSPVIIALPDGRIVYNASGSGNVWVNESGLSDGEWTEQQTNVGGGFSRGLQYVEGTGRIVILQGTWGGPNATSIIRHGEVDIGYSEGAYYQLVNRMTGQVIGTGDNTNDANIGNSNVPDVVMEDPGAALNPATQYWHVVTKSDGAVTLLNKSGGRAASIWTGNPTVGQRIGQWVDNTAAGLWTVIRTDDGYYRFQSVQNPSVYLSGSPFGGPVTLQNSTDDGSQEWQLVMEFSGPSSFGKWVAEDARVGGVDGQTVAEQARLHSGAPGQRP